MSANHPEPRPKPSSGPAAMVGDGRNSLIDAYQESLDQVVYLRKAIEEQRKTSFQMVREFHEAFGVPLKDRAELPGEERRQLRTKLLFEEHEEYLEAEDRDDIVEIADALADMVYIICGTAFEYGINLDAVFAEVHRSNMAKLGPDGKPIYRADGKILKPEGWTPPDIAGALGGQR